MITYCKPTHRPVHREQTCNWQLVNRQLSSMTQAQRAELRDRLELEAGRARLLGSRTDTAMLEYVRTKLSGG